MVETTSKYSSVRRPTRPSRFRSFIDAIPCTTVQNTIGAITIFTNFTNPSPSGFSFSPTPGMKCPSVIPTATAISTCTYSNRYHRMGGFDWLERSGERVSMLPNIPH